MKPMPALRSLSCGLVLAALAAPAAQARPPESGYFAFGLGYAAASGDRGVPLDGVPSIPSSLYDEVVRTDFGSGMSFELRFGWRFGPVAPELTLLGHGTFDFDNGAGYPALQVRFHPLMLVDSLADAKLDGSVFLGAGYAIGGYLPDMGPGIKKESKGWEGWVLTFGLGGTYELSKRVHLGIDLKFLMPQYSSWIFDYDDDTRFDPKETPSTLVIAPSVQIQAYF